MSSTDAKQEEGKVVLEAGEGEGAGKSSKGCCVHPEHKKKKKNPFAEGFADAVATGESEAKPANQGSDEDEPTPENKPERDDEGEEIAEENLISALEIPVHEELVSMVQFRIFDMRKVKFEELTNCKNLVLRQNLIHDLHELPANLHVSLQDLDLYDNKIKAIRHFEILKNLRVLDLSYNNIRIIENLEIPTLEVLFLTENKITKIQNLGGMKRLKQLELGSNRIRVIEGLEELTELEDLWLGKNKITKLSGLDSLKKLKRLSLQANRLTEIPEAALKNNTSLTDLHLSENGIKKIEHVAHLTSIRLIDFCFNPITAIHELDGFGKIEEFWMTDARLADWKEVEKLEKLKSLKTVYLERNPIEDTRYRHRLATMLPWLEEIDSWPVVRRDKSGLVADGHDPRGKWVDTSKAEVTFKASRGDAPIMPTAAEVEAEQKAEMEEKIKSGEVDPNETVD